MAVVRDGDLFIDKKKTRMKHQFLAAGAALCALVMTGCSNEMDDAGTQTGKQVTMTMQAATDGPQSRADYTDDETNNKMLFSWRSGDKISVVVDGVTGNENCQLSTTGEGKSAAFNGTVTTFTGTKNIYAFYPNNATGQYTVTDSDDPAKATVDFLSLSQAYTVGGAINNSFMVGIGTATADGSGNITATASLKQVMSIIKLNITNAPGEVTGVKLKCAEKVFYLMAKIKLSDASIIENYASDTNELSMTVTDGTANDATKAISFAMFPTNLTNKDITIEVTFNDGTNNIVKSIKKTGINFERNIHYVMSFDGTPEDPNVITVNGINVAVGNLVADGKGGCKIGAYTDNDLFFQFGSLIGWSATGDPAIAVKPANFDDSGDKAEWDANGKTWQGATGTVPFTTAGSGTTDEIAGIGDPCRYYLGGTWRLPTKEEFDKIFEGHNNYTGTWKKEGDFSAGSSSYAVHNDTGLKFPASGYRLNNGKLSGLVSGRYWSASASTSTAGYVLSFNSSLVNLGSGSTRTVGLAVRCVRDK